MLTRQEELDLFEEMKTSERARERFFQEKTPLVHKITRQFCGTLDEDYIQQGFLGLIRAIELFDPEQGFRFNTYAKRWIFAKIQIWNNKNRVIRYGKRELIQRRQQGDPTTVPCLSLDYVTEDGFQLSEIVEGDCDVLAEVILKQENEFVREELTKISDIRARGFLYAHFGLGEEKGKSYRQLGRESGISGERVRQIVQRQIDTMRDNYDGWRTAN